MSGLFRIVPILILSAAGIFLFFVFRRFFLLFPVFGRHRPYAAALSVLIVAGLVWWASRIWTIGLVVFLYILLASLVFQILHLFIKNPTFYGLTAVFAAVITGAACLFGYFNMHNIVRTDYVVRAEKLEERGIVSADGEKTLTVALIADLHLGVNMDAGGWRDLIPEIMAAKPDLVLLDGDIFDENTAKSEMEAACRYMADLKGTYGTYYVYGNHDPNRYTGQPAYTMDEIAENLEAAGITVLKDEVAVLPCGISLVGLYDASMQERRPLAEVMAEADPESYILVEDHQPVQLNEKAALGADLDVAGHTHGGQIWPLGLINTWFANDMNYGIEMRDGMTAVTTSGVAGWGFPVRTEKHCEYVIITIK